MVDVISAIDHHASSGTSPWHDASAIAQARGRGRSGDRGGGHASSLVLLVAVHVLAWLLVAGSRLPRALALAAAGYPLLFLTLFVVSRWDGTVGTPLMLALRPLTASLTAVWLVGTTPYPDLFAPLSRVLPRQAGDGLFLTYRALFALLARAGHLRNAPLRVRGGWSGSARRRLALAAGEGLGTLAVHGFDRSQQLYAAMLLRGPLGSHLRAAATSPTGRGPTC